MDTKDLKINNVGANYAAARAIEQSYKSKLTKLKYEEKIRTLIQVKTVRKSFAEIGIAIRNHILNLPNQLSPQLAGMTDEREINLFLDNHLRETLVTFSGEEILKVESQWG